MAESKYLRTIAPVNSNLTVVQNKNFQWGVIDKNNNIVVPFGKYAWIDGFQNGLAKVISHDDTSQVEHRWDEVIDDWVEVDRIAVQGIINEQGEEVLPLEYSVWKFYGKDFPTIKAFKNGVEYRFAFDQLNPDLQDDKDDETEDLCYDDDYVQHYEEFAGSYAQDVMGYSDEAIYDAFEGDPDNYWNID